MTLCLRGVLQGPTKRKDTAIKPLKIPIPLWLSRAGPALRHYSLHWTVCCTHEWDVCALPVPTDNPCSWLGHTEPQHPHIPWAGTEKVPQVLKTTTFSYPLHKEKHPTGLLCSLIQVKAGGGSGLVHAVCLGMQLKMCSWIEWATGRYPLLQEHHRGDAVPNPAWVNRSGILNTPKTRLE